MLALAAVNRLHVTPRLMHAAAANTDPTHALRPLIRNSALEIGLGLAVLALVGVLGTMSPAVPAQPA